MPKQGRGLRTVFLIDAALRDVAGPLLVNGTFNDFEGFFKINEK